MGVSHNVIDLKQPPRGCRHIEASHLDLLGHLESGTIGRCSVRSSRPPGASALPPGTMKGWVEEPQSNSHPEVSVGKDAGERTLG